MRSGWGPPPGRRPPWWPDGEPFPPRRWGRRGPPAFVRRIGCFFIAILGSAVLAGAVLGGLIARLGGWPVAFLAIVFAILLLTAGIGAVRWMTRPMDSLIEAAGRIEDGDYRALSFFSKLKVLAHGSKSAYTPKADACQACGLCVVACPEGALRLVPA